jgi:hypothetical protein
VITSEGEVAEIYGDELLSVETGEALASKVAHIPSEAVMDGPSIILKISPEALPALLNLFKMPAPSPEVLPPVDLLPQPLPEEVPCGCQDNPYTESPNFVTFNPAVGEAPKQKLVFKTTNGY